MAETVRWKVESGEGATHCKLELTPSFPKGNDEHRGNVNLAGTWNMPDIQPLTRCCMEGNYTACSFLPALQSVNIASHWMNLARNELAKECENWSLQPPTSCGTKQNRESVGMDLRATRQMISTGTKGKWQVSDITNTAYRGPRSLETLKNICNTWFIDITL